MQLMEAAAEAQVPRFVFVSIHDYGFPGMPACCTEQGNVPIRNSGSTNYVHPFSSMNTASEAHACCTDLCLS